MSREEAAALIRNAQLSLDSLQRSLDAAVRALPGTTSAGLPALLHEQKAALSRTVAEILDEWRQFEAESGLGMAAQGVSSPMSPLAAKSSEAEEAAAAEGATPFAVQLRRCAVLHAVHACAAVLKSEVRWLS